MSRKLTHDDRMAGLPPERRAAIESEYLKLLQREDDLQAVRQIVLKTQEELAEQLGTSQGAVSKLERRSDITLKNLRAIVRHLGGKLDIVVRLPNHRPIRLYRLSDLDPPNLKPTRAREEAEQPAVAPEDPSYVLDEPSSRVLPPPTKRKVE